MIISCMEMTTPMSFFIDTSAFYAYLVKKDRYHEPVRSYLENATRKGRIFFSSSFVLCETLGLLQVRHGLPGVRLFMEKVHPLIEWRWIDEVLFQHIWHLVPNSSWPVIRRK